MRLIDDFFTATPLSGDGAAASFAIELNAGHEIYRAHFPGMPVTPGVCVLAIISEVLERHIDKHIEIDVVKNLKFVNPISPVESPSATLTYQSIDETAGTIATKGVITGDNGMVFSKFSVHYKLV